MNTYQPPPFPIPYGNAPRSLNPQWPNVNLYGQQLVQPQPNPYFAHWPQNLGQTEEAPEPDPLIDGIPSLDPVEMISYAQSIQRGRACGLSDGALAQLMGDSYNAESFGAVVDNACRQRRHFLSGLPLYGAVATGSVLALYLGWRWWKGRRR